MTRGMLDSPPSDKVALQPVARSDVQPSGSTLACWRVGTSPAAPGLELELPAEHRASPACEPGVGTGRIQPFPSERMNHFINGTKLKLMDKKTRLELMTQHPYDNNYIYQQKQPLEK